MRMWKVDPKKMCRKHLLGEHVEMHMFAGTINKGSGLKGYIEGGLVEVHSIKDRHAALALEMQARGYRHSSPLPDFTWFEAGRVSIQDNERELCRRCKDCSKIQNREGDPKMKLNQDALKKVTEKQVKDAILILNHWPVFQTNPIKGKRHANKTVLAEIMVERVTAALDRGAQIPENMKELVFGLLPEKKPAARTKPPEALEPDKVEELTIEEVLGSDGSIPAPESTEESRAAANRALGVARPEPAADKPKRAKANRISEDMTICIVEEKAPKRPGTIAWANFEQYRKYPLVKDFLEKSGVDRPRAALAFDRYHGRVILK